VGSLAYTAIFATGVASLLWLYALRTLSAGPAGLGTLAVPVFGVVAAWLQLGEKPTGVETMGMALIIGGLAVLAAHGMAAGPRELESRVAGPAARPVTD
jgi:drug/metabolite transporter (DMT)-like permease